MRQADASPATILVVEDDNFIREALAELLEAEGFAVQTAAHGGLGIEALQGSRRFGLILLDLVMPEVSGLEFRRNQLDNPRWANIPTVVLTADASAASRLVEVKDATLVQKPLDLSELLRIVRQHHAA